MTTVSIIIPARNAALTLAWLLSGLAEQDYAGQREVILVDDGSSDATGSIGRSSAQISQVVRIEGEGAANSRNAGAAAAQGEWLAFLDADCRPTASWLSAAVRQFARADLVQGATLPDPSVPLGPFDRTLSVAAFTGLFESANLFVRREVFEQAGGFRHWAGDGAGNRRPFGEDVLFGWEASRLGARTSFSSEALVHHAVFHRPARSYIAERLRCRLFPPLAAQVPELREYFCYRRWFLSRRSAAFDLALAGGGLVLLRRSRLGLAAMLPYARLEAARARPYGVPGAFKIAAADLLADSVALLALASGSVLSRSPLV